VCDVLQPLGQLSPQRLQPKAADLGAAMQQQSARVRNGSAKGSAVKLLARVRETTKPLEADLLRLAAEVEDTHKALALNCNVHDGARKQFLSEEPVWVRLAAKRSELDSLCFQGNFEEAFQQALTWDEVASKAAEPGMEFLTESLCASVLKSNLYNAQTPEEFLAAGNVKLRSDRLKLSLISMLLQRSVADGTSVEQVEANLEWVLCIQHQVELSRDSREPFALLAGAMAENLVALSQGKAPASLATAAGSDRQKKVNTYARLAAKQLKLQRNACH